MLAPRGVGVWDLCIPRNCRRTAIALLRENSKARLVAGLRVCAHVCTFRVLWSAIHDSSSTSQTESNLEGTCNYYLLWGTQLRTPSCNGSLIPPSAAHLLRLLGKQGGSVTVSSEEGIWRGKLVPVRSDVALGPQIYTDGIFLGRLLVHISVVGHGPFTVRPAVTND